MLPLQDTVQARSFAIVNWLLITLNVVLFFIELSLGPYAEGFIAALGVVPARLLANPAADQLLTIFTSMFLHGGWTHLISNMLALYIFGDNVEDRLGHGGYILFYLLCGVIAGTTHILFNPTSVLPVVGASGAISGVLGAYFVLYPTARVITLIPIFFIPWFVEIPAVFYLGFWFVSQLLNGTLQIVSGVEAFGGVAWWAHAGGFIAGIVLVGLLARRQPKRRIYADEYWPW
jgi:membrane associated rhomboid family serine protease